MTSIEIIKVRSPGAHPIPGSMNPSSKVFGCLFCPTPGFVSVYFALSEIVLLQITLSRFFVHRCVDVLVRRMCVCVCTCKYQNSVVTVMFC